MQLQADTGMRVLAALRQGRDSPAGVARRTGVDAVEVVATFEQLKQAGAALEIAADGVALAAGFQPLDIDRLGGDPGLQTVAGLRSLSVCAISTSTNTSALGIQALPAAVLAEYQLAGRGRRQRRWLSPFGSSVLLSLAWPVPKRQLPLGLLPLVAGVGVLRALSGFGAAGIGLKWPNDLYHGGRKLAGILTETGALPNGGYTVVVGVGINVNTARVEGFEPGGLSVDLATVMGGGSVDRTAVAIAVIQALAKVFEQWVQGDVADLLCAWRVADVLRGTPVLVTGGGCAVRRGIAAGIGTDGALCLERDGVVESIHCGDVSVRSLDSGRQPVYDCNTL